MMYPVTSSQLSRFGDKELVHYADNQLKPFRPEDIADDPDKRLVSELVERLNRYRRFFRS